MKPHNLRYTCYTRYWTHTGLHKHDRRIRTVSGALWAGWLAQNVGLFSVLERDRGARRVLIATLGDVAYRLLLFWLIVCMCAACRALDERADVDRRIATSSCVATKSRRRDTALIVGGTDTSRRTGPQLVLFPVPHFRELRLESLKVTGMGLRGQQALDLSSVAARLRGRPVCLSGLVAGVASQIRKRLFDSPVRNRSLRCCSLSSPSSGLLTDEVSISALLSGCTVTVQCSN
ncbi:hypothetical protein Taro_005182, partial [Colocasia esculenta]|nr:hypothetical protein [Colocasia esculenta]